MEKNLPARPDLDHLKRQAKVLLAALECGETEAAATILKHLPTALGMTAEQALATHFRLADAQWAIARKTGFASWPHLKRHVEQLRALEGIWAFARLEIGGSAIPPINLESSRVLIDGDRFRTESPEATYEGVFNINVEAQPHEIDVEFVEGPEAGNWNFGIFRLNGDELELCIDINGKSRPTEFCTSPGTGHAYETLKRSSHSRPEGVTGGIVAAPRQSPSAQECSGFEFVECQTFKRLEGQWTAVKIVRDGQELPPVIVRTGIRTAEKNEVKIRIGGQTMVHALVRLDESADPMRLDYYNVDGACKGTIQHGLLKWIGEEACFCMAAPGRPGPTDFTSPPGSGRTLSQWRRKK